MRIVTTARCLICLLVVSSGCRSRSDLVEAELRTKDRMLRETREELDRSRMINESFEHEFLRQQQGLPPVENSGLLAPKDITLGRGTGGVDDDRVPGDEALQLVVVPRDEDGNPIRIVGSLTVTVWEIMPGGVKIPLSSWEVSAPELRRTWKSGLLGSGFFVLLHWKKWPTQERLRVAVQMALPDGRLYEADKDISIRPAKPMSVPEERMPLLSTTPEAAPAVPVPEAIPFIPAPQAAPVPEAIPFIPAPQTGPTVPEPPAWMLQPRPSIYGPAPPSP